VNPTATLCASNCAYNLGELGWQPVCARYIDSGHHGVCDTCDHYPGCHGGTLTLTREALEKLLRDTWSEADADWTSYTTEEATERKRVAYIAAALARLESKEEA